jgi:FG-GAP-like repeat/FG-GAP repeat
MRHTLLLVLGVLVLLVSTSVALAAPPPAAIVTGLDAGWPDVRGWDRDGSPARIFAPWGEPPMAFSPYPTYQNGVRVAVGDVNGDGRPEIVTAPGGGAFTELRVFDGQSYEQLRSVLPFKDSAWWAGAFVATGDTNGDGRAEIVDGLDQGCCTTLHVVDAANGNELSGFFPYGDRNEGGARVAAADLNGDGKAELLAVPLNGTQISAFAPSGGNAFRTFSPFGSEAGSGAAIAAADVMGTARPELIAVARTLSGLQVKVLDTQSGATLGSYFPYSSAGVSSFGVATGDVNGDGTNDIVLVAERSDGTQVKAIDATGAELTSFYVLDPDMVPGASIAAGDLDGDRKAEIVLGGGPTHAPWPPVANGPDQRVAVYGSDGTRIAEFSAYPGLFQGGVRVALGDLSGDGRPEVVTAPGPGLEADIGIFTQEWVNGRDMGMRLGHFLAFERSFDGGASVALGDVDGDGRLEVVVGSGPGRVAELRVFGGDGRLGWSLTPFGSDYTGGINVAAGDLNADGRAEVVAGTMTAPARVRAFSGSVPLGPLHTVAFRPASGAEVAVADLAGTGRGSIVVGASSGSDAKLFVLDPLSGTPVANLNAFDGVANGVRLGSGDLDSDGRDEILASPGFGGSSIAEVRIFSGLLQVGGFTPYNWGGAGMNVAAAPRLGLPIAAEPQAFKLVARRRKPVIVARFRDAAGRAGTARVRIDWGDGTSSKRTVVSAGGIYTVRSTKRYAHAGRYDVTVTLRDDTGRTSIARSRAIVSRRRG